MNKTPPVSSRFEYVAKGAATGFLPCLFSPALKKMNASKPGYFRKYARHGTLLANSLCGVWLLAPPDERRHYAFMVVLALVTATVNVAWRPPAKDGTRAVFATTAKVIVSGFFEVVCLWMLFHFSGGKLFWTELMTLTYFALFVVPLTVLFGLFLARPTKRLL